MGVSKSLNPFSPVSPSPLVPNPNDFYFYEYTENGHIVKCKKESGAVVVVQDMGDLKAYFNRAVIKAAVMTPEQALTVDKGDMTHIELAALEMASAASKGCLKSTTELLDRVLGKSKQISESTNLNLSIDDILNGVNPTYTTVENVQDEDNHE